MSPQSHLTATLAAAWEAELVSSRKLALAAERLTLSQPRARLVILAAFCRAHASRLMGRLSARGRTPLPVPPEDVEVLGDLPTALKRESTVARLAAKKYEQMAQLARRDSDFSTAWVCELNRCEEEERSVELAQLAETIAEFRLEAR
jgi:hypothetical protein